MSMALDFEPCRQKYTWPLEIHPLFFGAEIELFALLFEHLQMDSFLESDPVGTDCLLDLPLEVDLWSLMGEQGFFHLQFFRLRT